jgi:DNA-binding NtrC family response regulator
VKTVSTKSGTNVLTTSTGGELVLRRVRVRVLSGESRGREALLTGGTMVIGSHPEADLVVTDPTVSRHHVELALLAEGVRVRDLKSTNGTFVGSSRIESVVVVPAAEIKVGKTRLELTPADVPAPEAPSERTRFGTIVGATPMMRRAFGVLERAAAGDVPVLIEGEPGVGKSEAARSLHDASARAPGPYVVLDAGGDVEPRTVEHAFRAAVRGTLVLDRVDEVPAPIATALVSALEARERGELDVRPIGTSRTDLRARVEAGAAPRDLYFHVASVRVVIPPLRERLDDVPLLVRDLVSSLGYEGVQLSPAELAPLRGHDFPGNVRELRRIVEGTLTQSGGGPPPVDELWTDMTEELVRLPFKEAKDKLVASFEREYVERLLERHGGNVSRAAAEAGVDRNHLARLARKHNIR